MEATRTKGQVNAKLYCVFYLILRKFMTVDEEHNFAKMIADVKATRGRLRETIQVKELA